MTTKNRAAIRSKTNTNVEKSEKPEVKQTENQANEIPDQLFTFLLASVNDIQTTIKAVDTKVGFLLVFLGLPLGGLGKIFNVLYGLFMQVNSNIYKWFVGVFIAIFAIFWFVSFISALMALISISNPREHLKTYPENSGAYFRGGLFEFKYYDIINRQWFRKKGPMSSCSFEEAVKNLPNEKSKIINELVFEQMKLAYIRDTKIFRQNLAYRLAFFWIVLGFIGWLTSLILSKI